MPPQRRSPAGRRPAAPSRPRKPATPTVKPKPTPAPVETPKATAAPAVPAAEMPAWLERALVIVGTVIGVALSVATAAWEIALSPLYWGGIPLPIAPILAIATTLGVLWFTRTVTGRTGLALLPGVAWFIVMVAATMPRPNGSNLLPSVAWMGLVAVLAGSATWTIAAYRLIARKSPVG